METDPTLEQVTAEMALIEFLGFELYIRTLKYLIERDFGYKPRVSRYGKE